MGKLIYSMLVSLDGYARGPDGNFDWAEPDDVTHTFINQRAREIGTCLLGREMYNVMVFWETVLAERDLPPAYREYAEIWQGQEKIVYSTTLTEVASERTRIEREFDPEAVRALKASSELDISIDGPTLAHQAVRAGLVDEYAVYVCAAVAGGGLRFWPDDVRLDLELLEEQALGSGIVFMRYRERA